MDNAVIIPLNKRGYCASCSKPVWKTGTSAAIQYCRECRRKRITHGRSGYARGCRCDECRAGIAQAAREYQQKLRDEGRQPARGSVPATCIRCGKDFLARKDAIAKGHGKHCSLRCGNITKLINRGHKPRPPRKSAFRRRAEKLAAKAAAGTTGGNLVWVQGPCIVCREPFMSRGDKSRYCSLACRQKNRNKLHGLTWLDRMAIFARDSWTCHLCGLAVDYTAEAGHPAYPTLDHIVPRSHGGPDEPSNLATCHSLCNSIRRDLDVAEMRVPEMVATLRERIALVAA